MKITQYNNVSELEYLNQSKTLRLSIDGFGNEYLEGDIEIDSKTIKLDFLNVTTTGVKLKFSTPLACNITSGKKTSIICGVELSEDFDPRFPYKVIQDDVEHSNTSRDWRERVKQSEEEIKTRWNLSY